jgi:hypothetical protein
LDHQGFCAHRITLNKSFARAFQRVGIVCVRTFKDNLPGAVPYINKYMLPNYYEYPGVAAIVCPKCGQTRDVPLAATTNITLDYAGVCGASLKSGLRCDAMLILQVTAHLAPARQAS